MFVCICTANWTSTKDKVLFNTYKYVYFLDRASGGGREGEIVLKREGGGGEREKWEVMTIEGGRKMA